MRPAVGGLAGTFEENIVATRKPTVSAQNSMAVQLGPAAAALLVTDDRAVQSDPSRALQDLAEELGRMAARAVLRALDDPKTGLVLGLALLLISIIVILGGHVSTLGYAN